MSDLIEDLRRIGEDEGGTDGDLILQAATHIAKLEEALRKVHGHLHLALLPVPRVRRSEAVRCLCEIDTLLTPSSHSGKPDHD